MKKRSLSKLTLCLMALLISSLMLVSCDGAGGAEKRDCVVMIGDSIFALTGRIELNLRHISGQKFRTYYIGGTQMKGDYYDIESQYDSAINQGSIRTIIMEGGGNDFLFGGLFVPQRAFEEINAAYMRTFEKAVQDGVENIIVVGYYKTALTNKYTDQSEAEVEAITLSYNGRINSNGVAMKATYWDPSNDPWFADKIPAEYTLWDGIHPTAEASEEIARMIWQTMVDADIEQGEGCQTF